MDVCNVTFSASLVDSHLVYSATCSVGVLFAIVKLVTSARSSDVACTRLANNIYIYMALCAVPVLYPHWWEVCWHSRRSACAPMKCA